MSDFPAIAHVALTVRDLAVSAPWYEQLTGSGPVLDEDTDGGFHHTVFQIGGTLVGLHHHPDRRAAAPFDEFSAGLDHVGFGCDSRSDLELWEKRLDALGITHGGIVDAHYGSGLSFRDPDNIALEFFAPPA